MSVGNENACSVTRVPTLIVSYGNLADPTPGHTNGLFYLNSVVTVNNPYLALIEEFLVKRTLPIWFFFGSS